MPDTLERIEKTLDTLRPYISSHRGQVEVVDFDESEGVLLLRLGGTGSASWCPRCGRSTRSSLVAPSLEAQVGAALGRIRNPRLDNDLLSAGMIRDLAVTAEGRVSFTFLLSREDPATLVREARNAVKAVPGVQPDGVKITVVDPA